MMKENSNKCKDDDSERHSETHGIPKGEEDIDRGWAWVIFFAGFLNFFLCAVLYTTGVFNVMFLEQYQQSKAVTSWTGALAIGLFSLLAPLGSLSNKYVGPRITIMIGGLFCSLGYCLTYFATSIVHVIITFGVMQGTGFCLIYYSALVTIGFYFRRYRNIAFCFSLTGIAFGVMVFPLLLDFLIETYGNRGTLLIVGGIQMHSFVAAALTRPFDINKLTSIKDDDAAVTSNTVSVKFHEEKLLIECNVEKPVENRTHYNNEETKEYYTVEENNNLENEHMMKTITATEKGKDLEIKESILSKISAYIKTAQELIVLPFIAYCINLFLNGIGLYSMYVHFPAFALSIGITSQFTSILLTVMGAGSLACRMAVGVITNGSQSRTLATYIGSGFISGIVCLIGPYLCTNSVGQVAFAILFSFFSNIYIALMSPVVIDLMGLEKSVVTTGIALLMIGIGAVGGPPLLGLLADLTDTYYYIFPFNGCCFLVGGLVMMAIPVQRKFQGTLSVS